MDHIRAVLSDLRIIILNAFTQKKRIDSYYSINGADLHQVVVRSHGSSVIMRIFTYSMLWVKAIYIAMSAGRFDIIHAHGAVLPGFIGFSISILRRTPLFITEHTGPYSRISARPLLRIIAGLTLRSSKCVIAVSNYLRGEMISAHGIGFPIEVLHNPVDTRCFMPLSMERNKIMLFVGRLDMNKGLKNLLNAFQRIEAQNCGWKIMIVGEGPYEAELRSLLSGPHRDLRNAVILSGSKTKLELPLIMNSAAFLVHLSSHESFGITIVEALACGIPVLAGRNSAMKETVRNDCGILVDTDQESEIQRGMLKMMDTWNDYDRESLHRYAHEYFGYDVFRTKLLKLYRDSIN